MTQQTSWVMAIPLMFAMLVLPVMSAGAHTKVTTSVPANGATVASKLDEIELQFGGKMRLTVFKVKNTGSGETVSPSAPLPHKFVTHTKIGVPPLETGDYEVSWVGVGADGHVVKGHFKFSVSEK